MGTVLKVCLYIFFLGLIFFLLILRKAFARVGGEEGSFGQEFPREIRLDTTEHSSHVT